MPFHARVEGDGADRHGHETGGEHPGQRFGGVEVTACPDGGDQNQDQHECRDLQQDPHAGPPLVGEGTQARDAQREDRAHHPGGQFRECPWPDSDRGRRQQEQKQTGRYCRDAEYADEQALQSQMNSIREMYEARIAELEAENAALKTRVADLEAQLRTNSQNSSKPPSTDGPGQPATRSLRKPSKRKPGGQDGHRGQTLAQVSDPDVVIRHEPSCCRGCGSDLTGAAEVNCSRRQVFDIQPIKVHVTEHQIISRRCPCGKTTTGLAPAQAAAPVQYGPVM